MEKTNSFWWASRNICRIQAWFWLCRIINLSIRLPRITLITVLSTEHAIYSIFWEVKNTFLIFVRCWCKIDLCFRSFLDCENMTHIHESHIDILLSFFLVQLVCIIKWNFRPVSVKKWSMLYNRSVVTDCTFDKRFCQWAHFCLLLEINDELSIWTSLSKWSKLGNFTTMTKIGP